MRRLLLGLMLGLGGWAAAHAQSFGESTLTPEQEYAEALKLAWILDPGEYPLPLSHGRIRLPEGYSLLVGADAARYDLLWNGIEASSTEAIVFNDADNTLAYFVYEDSGHVAEDDWAEVDPAHFLKQLKDADAAANDARRKAGLEEFHTGDWLEPPHFDSASKTAYWAYELYSDKTRFINATAIRLSRTGYHRIIWVGNADQVQNASERLNALLGMLEHDRGYGYGDFAEGDKRAKYGIGALAATVLGVKLDKGALAQIGGGLLYFVKELGLLVLVVGVGIFIWRRRLRRSREAPPA